MTRVQREILFFSFFLFFIWGGWHSRIARNTQNWKVLSWNSTDRQSQDGLWNPNSLWSSLQPSGWACRVSHWQFLITYTFSVSLKFLACYITGQWGELIVKNATLCLHILSWHNYVVFMIFIFLWSIEFAWQNINQSETRTGDMKSSVELYA